MAASDGESKTKVVVFLGSGFSAALDLPTTDQLSERLLEYTGDIPAIKPLEQFISARICEFWTTVFSWRPGMRPPTLEDHFTQIDMAANSGHHLGPIYGPSKLRAIRRMTIHRIFTLLKTRGIQDQRIVAFFKHLNEALDVTFVTSNWDTEAESYLDLLGVRFNYGVDEVTPSERLPPAFGVPVLKLHGCTNRAYCDCCRSLIRFEGIEDAVIRLGLLLDQGDFELFGGGAQLASVLRRRTEQRLYAAARSCPDCGVQLGLRLATFSYLKDLNPHAFYTIWDKARTSLQLAEKWLFVGYSLPEADLEIRHLLKSAQLARRDPLRVSIEVVLKNDPEAGERYRRFFGIRSEMVFQSGLHGWIVDRLKGY